MVYIEQEVVGCTGLLGIARRCCMSVFSGNGKGARDSGMEGHVV